ncbi:hypothetical protein TNCV_1760851 [Trichonephila clavipes]|nr:hypothetical protein TNCV_1760851 [Trichonephila clavipes]
MSNPAAQHGQSSDGVDVCSGAHVRFYSNVGAPSCCKMKSGTASSSWRSNHSESTSCSPSSKRKQKLDESGAHGDRLYPVSRRRVEKNN